MVDSMSKSVASASHNSSQSHADNILDAWTALEALSPQTYRAPKDLLTAGGSIVSLDTDQEPWFQRQEARPNTELYYIVYLGSVDLGVPLKSYCLLIRMIASSAHAAAVNRY